MQSTVFVDETGAHLGRRGPVNRQDVNLSDIPPHVQEAVIAAENRSFRSDSGIAPSALFRAALATATGGDRQGGSTITQQYVKNALLTPEQSLSRKAREALIAVKLDRTRSKDEVLSGYLNTVYFGRGAAGIQAAARQYFGVDAQVLTLSQGAALAAIINLPSYYERAGSDPEVTAILKRRWAWVLDGMVTGDKLTDEQRRQVEFPTFRFFPPGQTEGQRQYLIDVAAAEAADRLSISQEELARGGYTVHTTFDLALQDSAVQSAHSPDGTPRPALEPGKDRLHTAVVGIVPGNGAVRVLYGGADYARQPFNDAVNGTVEAGSALAPFKGITLGGPLGDLQRTAAPTPLEMGAAHATLAAQGRYAVPYTVAKITRGGHTLHTSRPQVHTAMPAKASDTAIRQLALVPDRFGRLAGPAGSAGDRTSWSVSSTPGLSVSVALFCGQPSAGGTPVGLSKLTGTLPPSRYATRVAEGVQPPRPAAGIR
ncbi:transglycosylase domain-containing protein [Streptomyces sp. NPDC058701]|uniref:transglycosylase domain-containing protein n=1 Tax=Streptomyces sp. NPDC058701 TaxID=3346608 RepID=UPI00364D5177